MWRRKENSYTASCELRADKLANEPAHKAHSGVVGEKIHNKQRCDPSKRSASRVGAAIRTALRTRAR